MDFIKEKVYDRSAGDFKVVGSFWRWYVQCYYG
jgi:hypothetical protein